MLLFIVIFILIVLKSFPFLVDWLDKLARPDGIKGLLVLKPYNTVEPCIYETALLIFVQRHSGNARYSAQA